MDSYDLICVGSGFATNFFLKKWLELAPVGHRALILERGPQRTHEEIRKTKPSSRGSFTQKGDPRKKWNFTLAFGGSSNCWVGNTPRMMPSDFETFTRYGVGVDWPMRYDDLEAFYSEAEGIMSIAGPEESPYPRSAPYPLKAHRMNAFDRELKKAWPNHVFALPSARPSEPVNSRPRCCASSSCSQCPIDSKFTILNSMKSVFTDSRVSILSDHEVLSLDTEGGRAVGVRVRSGADQFRIRADTIVLGANALFNAAILLRTAADGPSETGVGITEQASVRATVRTKGLQNFDGSSYMTGHGYMFHDGEHRRERSAALLETRNSPDIRNLRERWRDQAVLKLIFEDYRRADNRVTVDGDGPPRVTYTGVSPQAEKGLKSGKKLMETLTSKMPVEDFDVSQPNRTESHIMCSVPMGHDVRTSVVDPHLVHHQYRNVVVAGASAFPTAAAANPTLTLSALSLWAATKMFS